jgi:HsdM N-terminal domain
MGCTAPRLLPFLNSARHSCDHRLNPPSEGLQEVNHQALSSFIWSVADLLRGDYKQSDYGKVILPFTVLRRLDCVLEGTKAAVIAEFAAKRKADLNPDPFLLRADRRLSPLLEFGRERDGIDLSKVLLTHHSLKGTSNNDVFFVGLIAGAARR